MATDVTRSFGDQRVLDGVSLEVRAGEVLGLIGPNGGGKSTLLQLMAGLVRPSSGEVRIGGALAHEVALSAAGRVGLITAEAGLYPLLTGRENLHWFGGLFGRSAAEVDSATQPLLERLSVADQADRQVHTYSSGMKQKFSLARALFLSPVALLLDEPTSNLDPVAGWQIFDVVREQADAGVAVVLCTHDLHAAEALCDRVILLNRTVRATHEPSGPRTAPPVGALLTLYNERVGP